MQYMGSKKSIARYLLPAILKDRYPGQWYVEPFCGGCNMIDKVDGERIANDCNPYLIKMWQALQKGWEPPRCVCRDFYEIVRANKNSFPPELVAFIGFMCSFGGKWWSSYAFNNKGDNYALRGRSVLLNQIKKLSNVEFRCSSYCDMDIPQHSIIYCDPPYAGTTRYNASINHDVFWQWCREKTEEGHKVFVSEYHTPSDFECVKEVSHKMILNKNRSDKRIEKLFRYAA